MSSFMEYCLKQYNLFSGWNEASQYSQLCSWSHSILDFQTLRGLSSVITKPSLLDTASTFNGSIGYIYTTQQPFDIKSHATIGHQNLIDQFTIITKKHHDRHSSFVYGRMFLPGAKLETMYIRRLSETLQCLVTAVNMSRTHVSPQVTLQLQYDTGKWCSECSYKAVDSQLAVRTLYHFHASRSQWSVGTELSVGDNKTSGMSLAVRYLTLAPTDTCLTYIWNPTAGNMSASCTTRMSNQFVLSSRYNFSVYSNNSDLTLGLEYTPTIGPHPRAGVEAIQKADNPQSDDSLFKLRWNSATGVGFLWESRFKNVLFCFGLTANLTNTLPLRTVGLEIQYFS